jgi:DNA primase
MQYSPIRISKLDWDVREFVYGASRRSLCQEEEGERALRYLLEGRGLDVETLAQFRLGFVPEKFGFIPKSNKMMFKAKSLEGRIIIPMFDVYGDLIALSARPLGQCEEQRYWNESFPKGEHLYGLNVAKYAIAKLDYAVVVEGQFDVMKMFSHGIENAVGMCGGAFTPIHALLLRRWTKNIIFVMDADEGGNKHTESIREMLKIFTDREAGGRGKRRKRFRLRQKINYAFVTLPGGYDPDDYLSEFGGASMRDMIRSHAEQEGVSLKRRRR